MTTQRHKIDLDKINEIRIVIVTHKRPNSQVTLNDIPEVIRDKVVLVTSKGTDDKEILSKLYPNNTIVDAPVKTISEKRQWVLKNCQSQKILMMDDDLTFAARPDKDWYVENPENGRYIMTPEGIERMTAIDAANPELKVGLKSICQAYFARETVDGIKGYRVLLSLLAASHMLDKFAHGSYCPHLGNDRENDHVFTDEFDIDYKMNYRGTYGLFYRRDIFLKEGIDFRDMPIREDFYANLSLLRKGYPNFHMTTMALANRDFGKAGGCSDERTMDFSNKCAEDLASKFPEHVKVTEKVFKDYPRKEVVVAWKKVFKAGVEEFGAQSVHPDGIIPVYEKPRAIKNNDLQKPTGSLEEPKVRRKLTAEDQIDLFN